MQTAQPLNRLIDRFRRLSQRSEGRLAQLWNHNKLLRIGLLIVIILAMLALLQPFLSRILPSYSADPMQPGQFKIWEAPSTLHPFGTDKYGRDVLALVLLGLRYSLAIGGLAGVAATFVGLTVGFVAGYKGGWLDSALTFFTDSLLVIPTWPILVIIALYVSHLNVVIMALLLAAFSWPFAARVIRSQVLSLRERPYVKLAIVSGMGDLEIIFQELVPNLLPFLGVSLASAIVGAIGAEVGLELIGLSPGNIPTLGLLITWGLSWGSLTLGLYEIVVVPALMLALLFLGLNLVNIGLEQAVNPRLRGVTGE